MRGAAKGRQRNREIEQSVAQVQAIITAERLRRERQLGLADFVDHLRADP